MGRFKEIDALLKTYNIVLSAYTAPQNAEAARENVQYNLRPTTLARVVLLRQQELLSKRTYANVYEPNVKDTADTTEKRQKFSAEAMNLYDFLISTYLAKRIAWILLIERLPVNWNEELLDFASYSLRIILLQLLHYKIPELSVTDVMCLSYPLGRLFDVFLRKRRMYPWKMEVKAVICSWITYFSMEVYVSKILFLALEGSIIELSLWTIFIVFAFRLHLAMLLQMNPLPVFNYVDEFLIQPLCASIAEYYPLLVPMLSSLYSDVLDIVVGRVD